MKKIFLHGALANGKHFLGYFKDIKDAAKTYNNAAKKLFGQFASVNKING